LAGTIHPLRAPVSIHRKTRDLVHFTCPTRQDGKYGSGEQLVPHTFHSPNAVIPGDIHYLADEAEIYALLVGFCLLSRKKGEGYWENRGVQQFFSNGQILARKE
jgi:hypothetical protein